MRRWLSYPARSLDVRVHRDGGGQVLEALDAEDGQVAARVGGDHLRGDRALLARPAPEHQRHRPQPGGQRPAPTR